MLYRLALTPTAWRAPAKSTESCTTFTCPTHLVPHHLFPSLHGAVVYAALAPSMLPFAIICCVWFPLLWLSLLSPFHVDLECSLSLRFYGVSRDLVHDAPSCTSSLQ